jgi:hypothetical protein
MERGRAPAPAAVAAAEKQRGRAHYDRPEMGAAAFAQLARARVVGWPRLKGAPWERRCGGIGTVYLLLSSMAMGEQSVVYMFDRRAQKL